MLSFFKRANAETAVSLRFDQVRAHLNDFCGPVSRTVWDDRFVIGYLTGAFHVSLKVANPPTTNPEYNALQSGRLWQRFTGRDPAKFSRDTFVLADNQDPDYLNGFDRGSLWGAMVTGNVKREHPEVAALLQAAKVHGKSYEAVHGEPSHHMASAASLALIGDFFQKVAMINQFAE